MWKEKSRNYRNNICRGNTSDIYDDAIKQGDVCIGLYSTKYLGITNNKEIQSKHFEDGFTVSIEGYSITY